MPTPKMSSVIVYQYMFPLSHHIFFLLACIGSEGSSAEQASFAQKSILQRGDAHTGGAHVIDGPKQLEEKVKETAEQRLSQGRDDEAPLVVLQVLPAMTLGGVERGVVEIAKYLRSQKVGAVVASADGPLVAELAGQGITHINLEVLRSKNPFNVLWRAPRALQRIMREHSVTLLHARSRTSAWSAWLAIKTTRGTGITLITTHHGAYGLDKARWKRAVARVMLWGDGLILPSSFMLDFVCQYQHVRVAFEPDQEHSEQAEQAECPSATNPGILQPVAPTCVSQEPHQPCHGLLKHCRELLAILKSHVSLRFVAHCRNFLSWHFHALFPSAKQLPTLVAVIPRGVDISAFAPSARTASSAMALSRAWQLRGDHLHVLHLGRLSPQASKKRNTALIDSY
jgi:glycosyltransferase involved in cell wall biosynthesis